MMSKNSNEAVSEEVIKHRADVCVEFMKFPSLELVHRVKIQGCDDFDDAEAFVENLFGDLEMVNVSPNIPVERYESQRLRKIAEGEKPTPGFPDLLVEDSSASFDAIEVKLESDSLRFNQVDFARERDLDVLVARVQKDSWRENRFRCRTCDISFRTQQKAESHFCAMRFTSWNNRKDTEDAFHDFWEVVPDEQSATRAINWSAAGYGPSKHRESRKSRFAAS
jgi:hypothetical protein